MTGARDHVKPGAQLLAPEVGRYQERHPHYDQTFRIASDAIRTTREAGKAEICLLVTWKRSAQGSWLGAFLALDDADVRAWTRHAFEPLWDQSADPVTVAGEAFARLRHADIPGFGRTALPSALLCAADPQRLAVYDRRAQTALDNLHLRIDGAHGFYAGYIAVVTQLRHDLADLSGHPISARDVDEALYEYGGVPPADTRRPLS
ncbi:MAG TPA: hypothetical protein VK662_13920 [Acidothermaceae bacterium]|jgi:hypothetical protein|nr:hypothetical protein [Acidothermaceae bacterium]